VTNKPTIPVEMETKLNTLLNDKRVLRQNQLDTFHSRAHAELDLENSGRHAKPATVIGPDGAQYPRQAANSFSNQAAIVGDEPPYDGDMSTPVVGESFEVAASLERSADQSRLPSHADGPSVEAGRSVAHHGVERPPNQSPTQPAETSQQSLRPQRKPPR
jgi:hypothetical protein